MSWLYIAGLVVAWVCAMANMYLVYSNTKARARLIAGLDQLHRAKVEIVEERIQLKARREFLSRVGTNGQIKSKQTGTYDMVQALLDRETKH